MLCLQVLNGLRIYEQPMNDSINWARANGGPSDEDTWNEGASEDDAW